MQVTRTRSKRPANADGTGVVTHAGTRLLVDLADATRPPPALSDALARSRTRHTGYDPGRSLWTWR
jgi:hypothetical protein